MFVFFKRKNTKAEKKKKMYASKECGSDQRTGCVVGSREKEKDEQSPVDEGLDWVIKQ